MTDEQILKKAIEKAINNNWNFWQLVYEKDYCISIYNIDCLYCPCMQGICEPEDCECKSFKGSDRIDIEIKLDDKKIGKFDKLNYKEIIFSHDFAKAYWGSSMMCLKCGDSPSYYNSKEENTCVVCGEKDRFVRVWQYHQQQMAIYTENGIQAPLQYLRKFL